MSGSQRLAEFIQAQSEDIKDLKARKSGFSTKVSNGRLVSRNDYNSMLPEQSCKALVFWCFTHSG